jgi:hypothetical protein
MKELKYEEQGYNTYHGQLENSELDEIIWYDNTIKKIYDKSCDFVFKIKTNELHLLDILKEKNKFKYLELRHDGNYI